MAWLSWRVQAKGRSSCKKPDGFRLCPFRRQRTSAFAAIEALASATPVIPDRLKGGIASQIGACWCAAFGGGATLRGAVA